MYGFTPLLCVSFRGYHVVGQKDRAVENRYRIIRVLLEAGAVANLTRQETNMTAMHWLAFNNDPDAIRELINWQDADHLIFSHDNNLPIDIAGTTPSMESVDVFLEHYAEEHKLPKAQQTQRCQNLIKNIIQENGLVHADMNSLKRQEELY